MILIIIAESSSSKLNRFISAALVFFASISILFAAEKTVEISKESKLNPQIGRYGESTAVDPDKFDFSPAERKLWMSDHLNNIAKPSRLYYEFSRIGSLGDNFTDSVYLDILDINKDGSKTVKLDFFTAERKQQVASAENLTNVTGNPVLGAYMQGDVFEMNRLTDGSWRYFQRLIKLAISKEAIIEPFSFEFSGETIDGEKIILTPFANDPRRKRYGKFANKRYEFILSDKVPGSFYQIRTVVNDNTNPDSEPLIEETLTLRQVEMSK